MFDKNSFVKIKGTNVYGIVISKNNNKCIIKVKDKTVTSNIDNLELVDKEEVYKKTDIPSPSINITLNSDKEFIPEIMLRHQTLSEAIDNLDRFIDKAILNKASYIKIIHGKNGGTLRKGVINYLENSEFIESFRLGYAHEGSYGVTIAKLK